MNKTSKNNKKSSESNFNLILLFLVDIEVSRVKRKKVAKIIAKLEDEFQAKPDGFAKHFGDDVKDQTELGGLSWRELLGIARDTFNNGFGKIGITYRSEEDYDQIKNGVAEFKGKFYCRVKTSYKKRTFYYRNHNLIKSELQKLKEKELGLTE